MRSFVAATLLVSCAAIASAQEVRPKDVREIGKGGSTAVPRLQELLKNPSRDVRVEVVRQLTEIRNNSIEPLIEATRDNDPDVQQRAVEGLVNFYYPGYVQTGILKRVGSGIKGKFTDTNDQVIEPYVVVRPEVIAALGALARGGGSMDVRAAAARGIGVLRGKAAIGDLVEATRTKNTDVIYESLIALQKIHDPSAAPRVEYLLRDLDPKVQVAAIETAGLLQNRDSLPALTDVLNRTRDSKVKRAALTAIAMLPADSSRSLYQQYLHDKDEKLRGAAAEGYGRLKSPADLPALEAAWQSETKTSPRLSLAFAQVMLGKTEVSEFSPLQFLVNNLNSAAYHGEAAPLLTELARDVRIRQALYPMLAKGTRDEKVGLCTVLARSGDAAALPELKKLSTDADIEVVKAAETAVRAIQSRS